MDTKLHDVLQDTLDWLAIRCGVPVPPRPPLRVRRAIRELNSRTPEHRLHAERVLADARCFAVPLLRHAVRSAASSSHATRAALLLHRFDEHEGAEMLHRLARDPDKREGDGSETLRKAVIELVGFEHYVRQAAAAVTRLEQRPESFKAIARFRQTAAVLRFIGARLPEPLLRRALVVRTVGGENLSLVRQVIRDEVGVAIEHVCMVRLEAAATIVHCEDRHLAYAVLADNLAHPNPAVKLTAMVGLEALRDTRAIAPLHSLAIEPDNPVRIDARSLLERLNLGMPDALTLLRPALPDDRAPETLVRSLLNSAEGGAASLLRPARMEAP